MIESLAVTLLPILFLVVLFGGGELFRRRNIDMDGEAPIDRRLFYISKYSIVVLWTAMVLRSWGVDLFVINSRGVLKWVALCLWTSGFILLFIGRFGLGSSFRIGRPKESTRLKVDGLFGVSRNPVYLGVYATLLASVLYTVNPLLFLAGIFVVAVHHKIIMAEEEHLRRVFGREYQDYCSCVRRYL